MEKEINLKEIMQEAQKKAEERGYHEELIEFERLPLSRPLLQMGTGFDTDDLMAEIEYMNGNWNNPTSVPIAGRNKLIILFKKVVFKCTRFIFFPLVNFQNSYNASNVKCINQIREYMAEMEKYKKRIEVLEKEVETLREKTKG